MYVYVHNGNASTKATTDGDLGFWNENEEIDTNEKELHIFPYTYTSTIYIQTKREKERERESFYYFYATNERLSFSSYNLSFHFRKKKLTHCLLQTVVEIVHTPHTDTHSRAPILLYYLLHSYYYYYTTRLSVYVSRRERRGSSYLLMDVCIHTNSTSYYVKCMGNPQNLLLPMPVVKVVDTKELRRRKTSKLKDFKTHAYIYRVESLAYLISPLHCTAWSSIRMYMYKG